jgi:hypothetical protein
VCTGTLSWLLCDHLLCLCYVEKKRNKIKKGKTFDVASLRAGQVAMLVIQTDMFFPFSLSLALHAGENEVNTLYSPIKPGNLLPLIFLQPPKCKPVSQDIQLQRWGSSKPGEPKLAPIWGHEFCHIL